MQHLVECSNIIFEKSVVKQVPFNRSNNKDGQTLKQGGRDRKYLRQYVKGRIE